MTDELRATCYFRVLLPLYFPVHAAPGDYLAVWPLEQNLWVLDAKAEWVVRRRAIPEGKLWTTLAHLLDMGVVEYLSTDDERRIREPAPPLMVADAPRHPYLRVIRTG